MDWGEWACRGCNTPRASGRTTGTTHSTHPTCSGPVQENRAGKTQGLSPDRGPPTGARAHGLLAPQLCSPRLGPFSLAQASLCPLPGCHRCPHQSASLLSHRDSEGQKQLWPPPAGNLSRAPLTAGPCSAQWPSRCSCSALCLPLPPSTPVSATLQSRAPIPVSHSFCLLERSSAARSPPPRSHLSSQARTGISSTSPQSLGSQTLDPSTWTVTTPELMLPQGRTMSVTAMSPARPSNE